MKITCQSCPAKYNVADEKVLGKVVKMRCRKCGATIVINGNELGAAAAGGEASADEGWTVNVDDGDQRQLSTDQLLDAFRDGTVNEETYCWRDGMADWLPLREIDELYAAVMSGGAPEEVSYAEPAAADGLSNSGETQVQPMPNDLGSLFGSGDSSGFGAGDHSSGFTEQATATSNNGNGHAPLFGSAEPMAAAPAAARRAGGRGAGADLFGSVATAGGEEDIMTSASAPSTEAKTGARNENSVLFSLSALTEPGAKGPAPTADATTATTEGSGLIDIRALSAAMTSESGARKESKVDDIMNLGGGGAFTPALTAPVLAPVGAEAYGSYGSMAPSGEMGGSGNKTLMIAIGVIGVLLLGTVITLIVVLSGKKDETVATNTIPSSRVGTVETTEPVKTAEPVATATEKPVGNLPKPPQVGGGTTGGNTGGGTKNTGGGTAKTTEPVATTAPVATNPPSLAEQMKKAAGGDTVTKEPVKTGSSAQFDRGAAAATLGNIASSLQSCKKGEAGTGRVRVTFEPSGGVRSAEVIEGPFVGSATGGCISGKFRGAHVPAFSPPEVPVTKSFSIN